MSVFGSSPDPVHFHRVRRLFETALALEGKDRKDFLNQECGQGTSLRCEVDALLVSNEKKEFLSPLPFLFAEEAPDASDERELIGKQVGSYVIESHIASGGMSHVFAARRTDGRFDLEAAIKILKRGLDTEDLLRRFRLEQHALARLNHPCIARLLDAGSMPDGRPYFVMERVLGLPIIEYCDRHRLRLKARVDLFKKVCEAVCYAHQRLVVHRDLKPSNILVTPDGNPKLLDFGIAKLLTNESTASKMDTTSHRPGLMTAAYASPEQLSGDSLTTSTDVYSLGVVLFELLVGSRPFPQYRPGSRDHEQALRSQSPPWASKAVGRGKSCIAGQSERRREVLARTVSAHRRTGTRGLQRQLQGDLDTIVHACLQPDPKERYSSVEQLVADLDRYLQGLPVSAGRSSVSSRMVKFVRRNKIGVAATAVILLSLLGGLILALLGLRTAVEERTISLETEKYYWEALDFVNSILLASSYKKPPDQLTLQEVLLSSVDQMRSDRDASTIVGAYRETALAELCCQNGFYDQAEELFLHALETRERLQGPSSPEVADSCLHLAVHFRIRGNSVRALEYADRSVNIYRAYMDNRRGGFVRALSELGANLNVVRSYSRAVEVLTEAVQVARLDPPVAQKYFVPAYNNLALAKLGVGEAEEAEHLLAEACALSEGENASFGILLNNLAKLRFTSGQLDEARDLVTRALVIQRRQFGADHPDAAMSLNNLALIAHRKGDHLEAARLIREVLSIYGENFAPDHPSIANSRFNLGRILRLGGDLEGSVEAYRTAIGSLPERFADNRRVRDIRGIILEIEEEIRSGKTTLDLSEGQEAGTPGCTAR